MTEDCHAAYLALCDADARARLLTIRAEWERRIPGTQRCMAYRMPALRKGRLIGYFAAFKRHIGIYPPVTHPPELVAELKPFANAKGNLAFPHQADLPIDLIGRVGEALAAQYAR